MSQILFFFFSFPLLRSKSKSQLKEIKIHKSEKFNHVLLSAHNLEMSSFNTLFCGSMSSREGQPPSSLPWSGCLHSHVGATLSKLWSLWEWLIETMYGALWNGLVENVHGALWIWIIETIHDALIAKWLWHEVRRTYSITNLDLDAITWFRLLACSP